MRALERYGYVRARTLYENYKRLIIATQDGRGREFKVTIRCKATSTIQANGTIKLSGLVVFYQSSTIHANTMPEKLSYS